MMNPLRAIQSPDPYPYYAQLTQQQPFYFEPSLNLWVAADAAAISAVLAAPQMRVRPLDQPIPVGLAATPAGDIFGQLVRMGDGELQQQLKQVIIHALSGVKSKRIRSLAHEITYQRLHDGAGINDLLFNVPVRVVATLCGLMPDNASAAVTLIADFVQCLPATATPEQQQRASLAAEQLLDLFSNQMHQIAQGTLLEALLHAATGQGWKQQAPLIANAIGFLSQTYDATAGLIGNTLVQLARYESPMPATDKLAEFVREVARYDAPIQNTRRFAAETFYYANQQVNTGQTVLLLLAAANRDANVNPEPQRFIPQRQQAQIYTFGAGNHLCPGADMAVEITCGVIAALLAQNTDLKSYRDVVYRPSGNARIPVFSR